MEPRLESELGNELRIKSLYLRKYGRPYTSRIATRKCYNARAIKMYIDCIKSCPV